MASADVRAELLCSICMEIYSDPVTLPCCHNFCRDCITQAWDHQEYLQEYKCPECQKIYRRRPELNKNPTLCNIANAFRAKETDPGQSGIFCTYCNLPAAKFCLQCETSLCDDHLRKHDRSVVHTLLPPNTDLGKGKCPIHKKVLEYYCTKDSAFICAFCRLDGKHWGHQVEMLEGDAKNRILRNGLKKLTSESWEIEERVQRLEEYRRKEQGKVARIADRVIALFTDIKSQLEIKEKRVLRNISKWEEQMSHSVCNMIQQMEVKQAELSRKVRQIEAMCEKSEPPTILQGPGTGDSCDTEGGHAEDITSLDVGDLDEGLITLTLHRLSDMIKGLQICIKQPTDMLLDEKMADNRLCISRDGKTASLSGINLDRPATPERFKNNHVISISSISSGQHSWVMDTRPSDNWRIGVCYPSVGRNTLIGNNKKSWCLLKDNDVYQCGYDFDYHPLRHQPSSHKFRIYVDYEAGQLSFYEFSDSTNPLFTFSATFTEPLHAAIATWNGSLTITN